MKTSLVPVLVTKYDDHLFTAKVVDGPVAEMAASSVVDCFTPIKRFLLKQGAQDAPTRWPELESYDLCMINADVRLFYRDGKRHYPASREITIPVRYVLGHYADESVECYLVDYGVEYHCANHAEAIKLIRESIQGLASNLTSRQLAATVTAVESEIRTIRVRLQTKLKREPQELPVTLDIVANRLDKHHGSQHLFMHDQRATDVLELMRWVKDASVLLVGPEGCGKSSIIRFASRGLQEHAKRQAKLEGRPMPPPIVWQSSAENLIAGMQFLGQWEERLEAVIEELSSIGGILTIDSLVELVRLGGSQPSNSIAAFLMPYVRRGELRLIAETSDEQLDAVRRLLPGWAECFHLLRIDSLSTVQTEVIAKEILLDAERNRRISFDANAPLVATRFYSRFMPYQAPPRGVVELITDTIDAETRRGHDVVKSITAEKLTDQFIRRTGLPRSILDENITLTREDVVASFASRLIGQSLPVESAADLVLRLKAGLCDPRRPIATLMFCGSTGVGKTQLAKCLSEDLFGRSDKLEQPLIRLDMSEYNGWDGVDRLMLASNGEISKWLGRLRTRPMSVVLLDEFEKASPEVHDCWLSALDEGRLTDRFGRTTTLCGAIIIMTTNVGGTSSGSIGFVENQSTRIHQAIEAEFRPEFLNRIDEILIFEPLSCATIREIVVKELNELSQREIIRSRGVQLSFSKSLVDRLVAIGFDPQLGARPLQRTIEREVVAVIARRLLEHHNDGPLTIEL